MKIVNPICGNTVVIAYQAENNRTQVRFDLSDIVREFPGGTAVLVIRRHGDTDPVPAASAVMDGTALVWTVNAWECAKKGFLHAQVIYSAGETVAKTKIYRFDVADSITATAAEPDGWQDWVGQLAEAAAEVVEAVESYDAMTAAATGLEYGQDPTAEIDHTGDHPVLQLGIPAGATGAQGPEGPAGKDGKDGKDGADGQDGADGVTFTPSVDASGNISWTNDGGRQNPTTRNIKGPAGTDGAPGQDGADGYSPTASVTKSGKVVTISITDKNGTTSETVSDGEDADPTTLIDDTAGAGDTDKTFSADKLTMDHGALLNAINDLPDIKTPQQSSADLYVCDENGNVIAEFKNGHIVTKNFDSSNIDGDLIEETVENTADLFVCDQNGNVIAEFANGHIKTKYFDSSTAPTSGIFSRIGDQTDGVYAACRWHQPTLSSKQFCLLLAGDSHNDATRMSSMIDCLNGIDAFDAGIMLGDMSGNEFTDPITNYMNAIGGTQKPFLTVLGNHDVVGAISDSDLYTKYGDCFQYADLSSGEAVSGKCYYYKDFATYKIRIIVMMQYDLSYSGNLCYGQDQIDWFIDVLNDTPSDYGVIIAEHTNPSRYMTYNLDSSVTSSTWYQSNYAPTDMSGDPVPDIVNAWINGTTLSQTYSYTFQNPPSALTVSVDFSSRGDGEFITYLGGHWHMNVLGSPTGFTDQMDCHVPAAGLSAATQGDMPRKAGTVSEDSLCAFAVDRDKKTVKIFQIGTHRTKDAVDRQYFKYSYGS